MQQSSATQSLHLSFWGLRKIVACSHSSSQCLLVSTVFGTVSSLHPTSFLMIFTLVSLIFSSRLSLDCSARRDASIARYTYTRTRMRSVPEVVTLRAINDIMLYHTEAILLMLTLM